MRITIRNVGGAFYPGNPYRNRTTQAASWRSLVETRADIFVVQEATGVGEPLSVPEPLRAAPPSTLDRGAGSVVAIAPDVKADLEWRPVHPVLDAFGAYLDFALVEALDTEVAVVSVHATSWRSEVWAAAGHLPPAPTGLTRPWPSDLLLDTLAAVLAGKPFIAAGDWNESPNFPDENDPGTREWFDRARRLGLVEAVSTTFVGPVRTNFGRNTKRSYQNDHVFMTEDLAQHVRSVSVWNEPHAAVSDHAGIIVSLE